MKHLILIVAVLLTATLTLSSCSTSRNSATAANAVGTNKSTTSTYFKEVPVDNPIYLGILLLDEPTTEGMAEICEYHHLTPESASTDGYTAYKASDGTEIRFKQSEDPTAGVNGNLIEIRTKAPQKTIDKIFKSLFYTKLDTKNGQITYERGSRQTCTLLRCTLSSGSPKTLTFRAIDNPI